MLNAIGGRLRSCDDNDVRTRHCALIRGSSSRAFYESVMSRRNRQLYGVTLNT